MWGAACESITATDRSTVKKIPASPVIDRPGVISPAIGMRAHLALPITSLLMAGSAPLACRSDTTAALTFDGTDRGPADGAPAVDAALGGFVIDLVAAVVEGGVEKAPAYTAVMGKIFDGATPAPVTWTVVAEGGGCRLLTPTVPFCNPGCGGGAACVEGGTCIRYPNPVSLGPVHVEGLDGGALDLAEVAGNYQPTARIPYPPLPEGAKVEITAPGGALGPLHLESVGIAPLELTSRVQPVPGQPLALTWKPPARSDIGRIEITMDLSHHGGSKGKLECDVADTGALDIPAGQITALMEFGIAGYPTVVVSRVASGGATTRLGRATLRVVASVERAVEIEGLRSCTSNEQCPAGMTCQVDLKCK